MINCVNYKPAKLLEFVRDGLVEQEHFGLFVKISADDNIFKIGDDMNYPFFLRSCAKPLQASLLIDFGLDEFYNMTSSEIAICCASHAGEPCHTETVKGFLNKVGIDETLMKCALHKPLSKTEQNKLILSGEKETILQNNCSGKHAMMLAICKKNGWDLNDYDSLEHPLQIAIKNKIYELCNVLSPRPLRQIVFLANEGSLRREGVDLSTERKEFRSEERVSETQVRGNSDYPVTKDGCGVPIYAMPLENMVKGYMNLFFDEKYSKIKDAFVQNPYLIGGEDRLDSAIIGINENFITKVGAGGLCIVLNLETKEGLIIKIMDCDMKARAICLIEALRQLNWLDKDMLENDLIKSQNKTDILTLHKEKIGESKCCFDIN